MNFVATALVILVLYCCVLLWRAAFKTWRAGQPLLPFESTAVPWGLLDLALAILSWLVSGVLVASIASRWIPRPSAASLEALTVAQQIPLLWVMGITNLLACFLTIVMLWLRYRVTLRELGWQTRKLGADLVLGLKAFAMLAPPVYLMQLVLTQFVDSHHPLIEMMEGDEAGELLFVAAFTAVIVAPLAEEFLFRVLLQGWLQRFFTPGESTSKILLGGRSMDRLRSPSEPTSLEEITIVPTVGADAGYLPTEGSQIHEHHAEVSRPQEPPVLAEVVETAEVKSPVSRSFAPIAVSAAFFALSHWSHGPDPIPLFFLAVGLGYLYQRTGRILPCILVHFLLNAASLIAFSLAMDAKP